MKFWKYHGLGNDFVLVDGHHGNVEIDYDWCREKCDRHFGIGADGVLFIMPGQGSDITMRIVNADGTEAEMCGNGIRCVAKYAYDNGLVEDTKFTIGTLKGNLEARVSPDDCGAVRSVRIDMGAAELGCAEVPVADEGERFVGRPVDAGGTRVTGTAVSMGNPHFVTFDPLDAGEVLRLGPLLESHPLFPRKANVEFARIVDGGIDVEVYERGAGWTLACGTGACAAAVAAAVQGMAPFGAPVDVRLPGGTLKVTVGEGLEHVYMEGPAEYVYYGEYADDEERWKWNTNSQRDFRSCPLTSS